jgi:hypothetical protein
MTHPAFVEGGVQRATETKESAIIGAAIIPSWGSPMVSFNMTMA